ncbi:MAG: lipopolysaccharide kinase InaA family protein [Planctomycetota bacterium]
MRRHRFAFQTEDEATLVRLRIRSTQEMLRRNGAVVARSTSSETLRLTSDDGGPAVFLKRYHVSGARRKWRGLFRNTFFGHSRAAQEWQVLLRLQDEGLNPVDPIAFGEIRTFGFVDHAFVATRELEGAIPLDIFIPKELAALGEPNRRRFLDALAEFVSKLHRSGFVDRDLHWRNLLVRRTADGGFELGKIDSPRGHWPKSEGARTRGAARDLAALDLPAPGYFRRTERLRFLDRYAESEDTGRLARRVLEHRPEVKRREGNRRLRGEPDF